MTADVIPFDPFPDLRGASVSEEKLARVFAAQYRDKLAFCHSHKAWFQFDGAVWREQQKPVAFHLIREMAASVALNAANKADLQKSSFCSGVEKFCRADPIFARQADDWDRDIWLIGTPFGAIDLRTGEMMRARPSDMITKATAVHPADTADCPLWMEFLNQTTAGDQGLVRFLQQICGYALTGDTSEQVLFFIFGPGGNGKGVFLFTTQGVMADYSVVAPMEALEKQKTPQHTTDLAMMRGARLVSASETDEGGVFNEKRIKALTGGDPITARFMHSNNITFTPQMTLLIIGNHKPSIRTVDDAMRRRINMVPFRVKPDVPDITLPERLKSEWPGILRWMINGNIDRMENGLIRPPSVLAETRRYFDDQDVMGEWLDTFCEVDLTNEYLCEKSSDLFASWEKFAKSNGVEVGNTKTFRPAMERMGFNSKRSNAGVYFHRVRLRRSVQGDFV